MGTNQGKTFLSFKTRKDQVFAVFSLTGLLGCIGLFVKLGVVLWEIFTIAGSYATSTQLDAVIGTVRKECIEIVAAEKQERKEDIADLKIDMRDLRNKCLRGYGR